MPDPIRYPVGPFAPVDALSVGQRGDALDALEQAPALFRAAVEGLSESQIDTPYRDGGWTVRQVVHHVADSHLQGYVRCRVALTAEEPTIGTYDQVAWAELPDSRECAVSLSLDLLDALHARWVFLLRGMPADGFRLTCRHPERGVLTLDWTLQLYAWHGRHHTAHITSARKRHGWYDGRHP